MNPLRIIIIDDTEDIHNNIKVLFRSKSTHDVLDKLSQEIFGKSEQEKSKGQEIEVHIDSAYQGKQGFEMIRDAYEAGNPYSVAVVDMRMPPGWDGLMTIEKIRTVDTNLEIIISSAYSDYSWQDIADRLGVSNKYLFLSKPFEVAEMKQMIVALGQKWKLDQENQTYISKLEEAHAAVESAIRAKEDFLGVMSHELRTPLNIIIMTIEDFLEAEKDPTNARILKNSEQSAKYLARLIDNIMYFIQLDSHNFRYEESSFQLSEVVEEVKLQVPIESKKNIQFEVIIDERVPEIKLDRKRLRVALLQLIDNAVKFTDEGTIKVSSTIDSSNPKHKTLSIKVEDTGIGMGNRELEQAFDLFFQGESVNHHSRTGTGVGLSLCQKIVESLGGTVKATSQEGKGSQFEVKLPLGESQSAPQDEKKSA